jgi:hypothetical protein
MPDPNAVFLKKARKWARENNLHGPQAFLRYTMLNFVEAVNKVSSDFVFKGGNLLWVYIKTPRATIDLDFATRRLNTHDAVRKALEKACLEGGEGITYTIKGFSEVGQDGKRGAEVAVRYETDEGASNTFGLDIVYAAETEQTELPSPLHNAPSIQVATVENIISDKLSAAHRFKGGNTRMKDIDDLWRLSHSSLYPDWDHLEKLLRQRSITNQLDPGWIGPDMKRMWESHRRRYKDLPAELSDVFEAVNAWLKRK